MHASSRIKVETFLKVYGQQIPRPSGKPRVLEVGSKSFSEQDTYRPLFDSDLYDYSGLDVESGLNVDIVPGKGYVWDEIANESFDLCISGQTFEHNPFFWVTFAEMSRVVSPKGFIFVVAPGAGEIHRYPYDCWRFYPDSWLALCSITGMEHIESYFESDDIARIVPGGMWRDSALIARKPEFNSADSENFYDQIGKLTSAFRTLDLSIGTPNLELGPCFKEYERSVTTAYQNSRLKNFRKLLRGKLPPLLQKGASFLGPK